MTNWNGRQVMDPNVLNIGIKEDKQEDLPEEDETSKSTVLV